MRKNNDKHKGKWNEDLSGIFRELADWEKKNKGVITVLDNDEGIEIHEEEFKKKVARDQ